MGPPGEGVKFPLPIRWIARAAEPTQFAVCARFVSGITFSSTGILLVSALVLGLVNAVVRPIMVVLTLPITLLTLGLFYLIVNGAALAIAAGLVPGFRVASLGSAVLGALIVSLVSYLLGRLLEPPR